MRIKAARPTFIKTWGKKQRTPHDEPLTEGQKARLAALVAALQQPKPDKQTPADRLVAEAAAALGITLNSLNADQRRLLVTMGSKAMTNAARLRALEDAR